MLEKNYDVSELSTEFAGQTGVDLLESLLGRFQDDIAIVSSFGAESAVLLHMAARVDRSVPVIFVDTNRLFAETLSYRDQLISEFGLRNVQTVTPDSEVVDTYDSDLTLYATNSDMCCGIRKVAPLERALRGYRAWISGRKRFQSATRASLQKFEYADWRLKINPLVDWEAKDIADYMAQHQLPAHPLVAQGYLSIGCAPCSSPVSAGEDPRSGRWRGQEKTECGIHWSHDGKPLPNPALSTGVTP